jgi:hypothetical protein
MWRLPRDKRLLISESHGNSNQWTPCRGNLIHMTRTLSVPVHVHHSYASCMWQPFTVTQQSWTDSLLPRKSDPDSSSQLSWVACRTCLSFSPKHNQWSSVLKPNIYWQISYINLLDPYHQYVISTFNTCSRGPTHRSLTNTGGGYNLRGAGLPHHTHRPSQLMVLHFPPKGPTRSQVKHPTITNWTIEEKTLNLVSGSLHSTSTAIYHLSIALLMVTHQEIGSIRMNKKVNLNATTVTYNSYKLNTQS